MTIPLLVGLLFASLAHAVIETYAFSDPELAQRYRQLSAELRCPKCQNQNIADSNAPIAKDLRRLLHEQLEAGASDAEILEFMVSRYGEFVLYKPRYGGRTALLWAAPVLLLLAALVVLVLTVRSRARPQGKELNADDEARLASLLDGDDEDNR